MYLVERGHGACEALEGPYCYRARAEIIVTAWSVPFFLPSLLLYKDRRKRAREREG
jgi:hypothetical protein